MVAYLSIIYQHDLLFQLYDNLGYIYDSASTLTLSIYQDLNLVNYSMDEKW